MKLPDSLLATALNTIAESSLITDADQLIIYANPAFLSMTGYAAEEVIGINCRFLQDATTDLVIVAAMRTALAAGDVFRGVLVNRRKDGSLFDNSITVSPIRGTDGVISHFVSIQTDVTVRTGTIEIVLGSDAELAEPTGLAAGVIEMYMQPIVDITTGAPVIVEALARLIMPDGRMVTAAAFVPALSIVELDELFVTGLDQALASMARWEIIGLDVSISVNLDPATLMNPLSASWVDDALRRHRVAPRRLILELLETRAMGRDEQTVAISAIRQLGVRLAIDDLGSGHSSLQRVALYDFDIVKIDAGIVAGMTASPLQTLSVISALTQLCINLGRDAVVEGLETIDMVGVVAALGGRLGQGYHFAHPMPAAEIPAWADTQAVAFDGAHLATYSAVLAYHWRHSRDSSHPGEVADCPITGFLGTLAVTVGELNPIDGWHASQHGRPGGSTRDDGLHLTNWLADRVTTPPVAA